MRKLDSNIYNKDYFLNAVEGFNEYNNNKQKLNPKYNFAIKLAELSGGEKILDYGCGRGEVVIYTAKYFNCTSTGIDYSKDAILLCIEKLKKFGLKKTISKRISFLNEKNLNKLPFKDASIDRIFYLDVMEHMYPEEIELLFLEFKRVLKSKGRIIIHTAPNKDFYDIGYPRYTYYINRLINFFFKLAKGRSMNRSQKNPRSKFEQAMHINEQTVESVSKTAHLLDFKYKVFLNDSFIMNSSIIYFIYYLIAQPFYIPFLKKIFCEHLWCILTKE
ncbi:MAG: class I SAM-dependent methyltransferase [Minisyncoccia bacterium]